MSAPKRICPVKGCAVQIANKNMLMCPSHWAMCSKPLRSEVWRWWGNGKPIDEQMHAAACRKAIAEVEDADAINHENARQAFLL